jgi:subtilisin-like proprotein convertase family protein
LGGATAWGRWVDRAAIAHNTAWLATWTTQQLVSDWLWRDVGAGECVGTNGTQAAIDSPTTLWRGKFTPRRGTERVEIYGRVNVVLDGTLRVRLEAYKDTTGTPALQDDVTLVISAERASRDWHAQKWWHLATVDVTAGTATELLIKGGFLNANLESTAATTGYLELPAVYAVEVPGADATPRYAYYDSGAITTALNDPGTTTTTLAVAPSFVARHVRVFLQTSHATPANLTAKLTKPSGSAITFATGAADGWYSDDLIDDTATDGGTALAAFVGAATAGTWTLTLVDSAGGGNIERFKLEIW